MQPIKFKEENCYFGPPEDLTESQCSTIGAFKGIIEGGSLDGCLQIITAWKPNEQELKDLNDGKPIFLSCIGNLPPHFLCTSFEQSRNVS